MSITRSQHENQDFHAPQFPHGARRGVVDDRRVNAVLFRIVMMPAL